MFVKVNKFTYMMDYKNQEILGKKTTKIRINEKSILLTI